MTDREYVSLKEHFEKLLEEADTRYQQRFDAEREFSRQAMLTAKEAVVKAETAMEKRFDNTNEWRQTFDDLAQGKLSRAEYFTAHNALIDKVNAIQKRVDLNEGKDTGIQSTIALGLSILAVLAAVLLAMWKRG